jgi:2-polyprenyl-3-methyl-5-hydroxy-6-metoxy-1,4-benzoquinol methylase
MKIKGKFAKSYDSFMKRPSFLPPGLLEIVKSTSAKSILEFGCGTGTVAVGLSLAGYDVTGVDYSADMLKAAREKAKKQQAQIRLILGDISLVGLNKKYDLILCLGNTIPHFTSRTKLKKMLDNCEKHLGPGGHVLFQQLNYDRILKEKPATFAIDIDRGVVRFKQNRYGKNHIHFVVTIVDGTRIPPRQTVSIVKLKPWTKTELKKIMTELGFKKISFYGDYNKGEFSIKAKDLIILAKS